MGSSIDQAWSQDGWILAKFFFLRVYVHNFTKKVNVKKQRFDRSTVIFKLKGKIFACAQIYTIDYKNANETVTKTLKYLHRNNAKDCGMSNKNVKVIVAI